VLTALLTDSGTFPIRSGELTGDPRGVALASRANALATLSAMAFDRHHPGIAVAASPFTGIFLLDRSGTWHTMPSARLVGVSSVALANGAVYAATEGNGLWRLSADPGDWPIATYVDLPEFVVTRSQEQPLVPYVYSGASERVSTGRVHLQSFDKRRVLIDDRWLDLSAKRGDTITWKPGVDVVRLAYEPARGTNLAPSTATFKARQ
jgi:hypothetical protein